MRSTLRGDRVGFGRALCGAALWCSALLSSAHADEAEPDFQAAAKAYREGQLAQGGDNPAQAARWFELAYSIAPTPQAIRNAIRSHLAAEQGARAANLALVAQRRYADRETNALTRQVLGTLSVKLARLTVKCGRPCELSCDGKVVSARPASEFDVFMEPGEHALRARFAARESVQQDIDLSAGQRLVLTLETVTNTPSEGAAPASTFAIQSLPSGASGTKLAADDGSSPFDRGAPPWIFWAAAGLTVVGAAAGGISGIDTLNRHDAYLKDSTPARYYGGIRSQRRTNLLFLSTGVFAALTVGLAFFTDWEGEATIAPRVSAKGDQADIQLERRF